MADSIIERAIAAINDRIGGQMNDRLDEPDIQYWLRDTVAAVLRAIREPSEAMLTVGTSLDGDLEDASSSFAVPVIWQAMIDAALADAGTDRYGNVENFGDMNKYVPRPGGQ